LKNKSLIVDYIARAGHRLAALDVLFERESWADVVREAQETVELALKSLIRLANIEAPRVHDVSQILSDHHERMPASVQPKLERLSEISRELRRDRELAFYGSEDLTPSEFYRQSDAVRAREAARWVVSVVREVVDSNID
jgi:HEPN domain-containing protein